MDDCITLVRPHDINLVINTSAVTLYDGVPLVCVDAGVNPNLNAVLHAIDVSICALEAAGITLPLDTTQVVGATTITDCVTLTAGEDIQTWFETVVAFMCDIDTTVTTLKANQIDTSSVSLNCVTEAGDLETLLQNFDDEICAILAALAGLGDPITATVVHDTIKMIATDFVVDSTKYTFASVGAVATIGAGISMTGGKRTDFAGNNITLQFTKDNYVYISDTVTGVLSVIAVTVGNPQPSTVSGTQVLWKATTNGVGVTATTDLRNYAYAKTNSIKTAAIQDAQVTSAKLTTTGVTAALYKQANVTVDAQGRLTAAASDFNLAHIVLADKQVIRYNSGTGKWENIAINGGVLPAGVAGQYMQFDGANWVAAGVSVSVLSDVVISGLTAGDVLTYSGASWVNTHAGVNAIQYSLTVNLSSPQVLALFTTPIVVSITAPGATKLIEVLSCVGDYTFNTVAYAGNPIRIRWTGGDDAGNFTAGFTTAVANQTERMVFKASSQPKKNATIELYNTADPTLGNGSYKFSLLYRIVTF